MTQRESKKVSRLLGVLFSVSFALLPIMAHAAELILSGPIQELHVGDQLQVELLLTSRTEEINAIEASIIYLSDTFTLAEIREGGSLIPFWIRRPSESKEDKGKITFSGLIPGGVTTEKGRLFSIIFKVTDAAEARDITLESARLLVNDGKGTVAETALVPYRARLTPAVAAGEDAVVIPAIVDNDLPEEFSPVAGREASLYDGDWFVAFATQDKGSGLDHYEAQETERPEINPDAWQGTESPYRLSDQRRKSYIYVKAVDRAGHERVAVLPPRPRAKWYASYLFWCIIIVVAVISLVLWKKPRRSAPTIEE